MLLVTRERLLVHLLDLGRLSDLYQRQDPTYVTAAVEWISKVERTLQELRSPLAGVASSERGLLLATADGLRDPEVEIGQRQNNRRVKRATTAKILARLVDRLETKVAMVDARFDIMIEKVAQLIAVASSSQPLPSPMPGESRSDWLERLWKGVSLTNETRGMYTYLRGALSHQDLMYLVGETVNRLHEV